MIVFLKSTIHAHGQSDLFPQTVSVKGHVRRNVFIKPHLATRKKAIEEAPHQPAPNPLIVTKPIDKTPPVSDTPNKEDAPMNDVLVADGFTFMGDQDGAKVFHRAGKGHIAIKPDGSWVSSETGAAGQHNGKGEDSLRHFVMTAFLSHGGGPKNYKPRP